METKYKCEWCGESKTWENMRARNKCNVCSAFDNQECD